MDGVRLSGVWKGEPCPNPFRAPPSPFLIEAQKCFDVPIGFNGRVGALVYDKNGALYVRFAVQANRPLVNDWKSLTQELLWPSLSLDVMPQAKLFDADGNAFSFRSFLSEHLNAYPAKDASHGGKKIAWFKGQMLYAMRQALSSPSVVLLNAFNRERQGERLVAFGEWYVGRAQAHDIRFDQAFYPPLSSGKDLVLRLLGGKNCFQSSDYTFLPIPVLYEDKDLLIVCKPPHLASVPSATEGSNCLSLLAAEYGPLYDVHRLDMATSGVIVYAKNREVQSAMQEAFRNRKVVKHYVALLDGIPELSRGSICLPLGVNRLDRPRQCVLPISAGGKAAETYFEVIGTRSLSNGKVGTLIRLAPHTGRTHQLRVHCAHKAGLATPIYGDVFYGKEGQAAETGSRRLYLHAECLCFEHPTTGKSVEIISECDF